MSGPKNSIENSLEKSKSFDKRLSLLFNSSPFPNGEELNRCLDMVVEKAKYGEHFAQIAYMCEKKKIANIEVISRCAARATEHPSQTGKVLRALFFNGFISEGVDLWKKSIGQFSDLPSFTAQILACGRWFEETRLEAEGQIKEFLKTPEGKEYEELTAVPDAPEYINI